MLDVGFQELVLLAFIGLLVLGPERLPAVLKTLGTWVRKGRRMASEFQRELEKEVDLQEFRELRKDIADVAKPFDEAAQKVREIEGGLRDAEHSLLERQRIGVAPEARHDVPDAAEGQSSGGSRNSTAGNAPDAALSSERSADKPSLTKHSANE